MSEEHDLKIYKSNKLESFLPEVFSIIGRLAEDAPLKKKSIIVQSDGMERWLTLRVAEKSGVLANFDFVKPDRFLRDFAEKHFGITRDSVYNKKKAEWALYSLLRNEKTGVVGKYIGGDDARAFRFSRTFADMIEQYYVYCPGMMECWRKGVMKTNDPDESWQFEIFRKLAEQTETRDFSGLFKEKCKSAPENADYPKELILFGISIMNKYHLDMFRHLSALFPVHIFSVSPSQAYFSVSKKKGAFERPDKDRPLSADDLPDTFFGRFCAAGLDFFNFLLDNPSDEKDLFARPEGGTLLRSIQRDILDDSEDPEKAAADDGSVKIISCRDKMREIEVLKDTLLELFNKDETLRPEDVAVMAPKINDYVPYITAVFGGTDPNDKTFIPWVISDRTFSSESRIASTFLAILKLAGSDLEKSKVLSIFRSPCVCAKFGADERSAAEIEKLVNESGVRWGLDAASREGKCGEGDQNTWDFGLSRIMMSFVMPFPEGDGGFGNIIPMESVSKETLDAASGFITFAKNLFRRLKEFTSSDKKPDEFKDLLEDTLEYFFAVDKNDISAVKEVSRIREVIDDLAEAAGETEISFSALLQYLEDELGIEHPGKGFFSAKVNFCSLKPLRALPFKVICLIGMGDGEFPRTESRCAFDLTQKRPVVSEERDAPLPRSTRENDKYLFVEAVISAREKLFISYEAKDISEDSKKHRSAALPVRILEKYIELKSGVKADKLEVKYPVQPFSGEYFRDGTLKTFSKKDFKLAQAMFHVEQNPEDLLPERLSRENEDSFDDAGNEVVDLEKLISFFKDPAKFYLTKTLKIAFPEEGDDKGDDELFEYLSSDGLLKYDIKKTYVDMAKKMPEAFFTEPEEFTRSFVRRIRGEGKMPLGAFGEVSLKGVITDKKTDIPALAGKIAGRDLETHEIGLDLPELSVKLAGTASGIDREHDCMVLAYPVKYSEKYKIEVMIRHIAANAAGLNVDTCFYCQEKDKNAFLKRVSPEEARFQLVPFLKLWKFGKRFLPLFDPDVIGEIRKARYKAKKGEPKLGEGKNIDEVLIPFFNKKLEDGSRSSMQKEFMFALEQFFLNEELFLSEFPTEHVLDISGLLEKYFYAKEK